MTTGLSDSATVALLETQGFSMRGNYLALESPGFHPFRDCMPCTAGTPISLGASLGAFVADVLLNGKSYQVTEDVTDPTKVDLEMTGSTIAPPAGEGTTLLQAPFNLTGTFNPGGGQGVVPLSGRGTATLELTSVPHDPTESPLWATSFIHYDFDNLTATPEPTTLALIGTGFVFTSLRRHRTDRRRG